MTHPYDYPKQKWHITLRLEKSSPYWRWYQATFHSAYHNHYQKNDTAMAEHFLPRREGCFPLVIMLPATEEKTIILYRALGRNLARMSVASFILYLPYQRRPETGKAQLTTPMINNWLEMFQTSVINARQIVDWTQERKELDHTQIAIIGTSMGGIASAIAMGVDKRIAVGIFVVTGGNMERIAWGGNIAAAGIERSCSQAECHEIHRHYPRYLAMVAEKGIENVVPTKECFQFDPLTFAPYLHGRPMLMINAEYDDFVPKRSTLEFWEACNKPPIIWLPAKHATIYRHYHRISNETIDFLGQVFDIKKEGK